MSPLLRQMAISGGLLAAFAVVGALLLAVSHAVTAPRIAANVQATLERRLGEVVPDGAYDGPITDDTSVIDTPDAMAALGTREPVTLYRARRDGDVVAAVFDVTTPEGYGGDIRLLVGVDRDGVVTGVRAVSHRETPGLGDKIETGKTDWILGFTGRSLGDPPAGKWQVERDGGVFDQFSGATITPRAVVRQVARVLTFAQNRHERLFQRARASVRPSSEAGDAIKVGDSI